MKNAIILHGKPGKEEYYDPKTPSSSNYHWLPWLQKQLLIHDIKADTPEVPHAYAPKYELWTKEVERFEITPETILVGHSCGGGFWFRYLSEHPKLKVGKVILVAPWLDPNKKLKTGFFNFILDKQFALRTKNTVVFYSDNDMQSIQMTVQWLINELNDVNYRKFHNYGHFTYVDMKSSEFPELLEECLKA